MIIPKIIRCPKDISLKILNKSMRYMQTLQSLKYPKYTF